MAEGEGKGREREVLKREEGIEREVYSEEMMGRRGIQEGRPGV